MEVKNIRDAVKARIKEKLDPKIRAGVTKESIALQKTIALQKVNPNAAVIKAEDLSDSDYEAAVKESIESAVVAAMEDYIIIIEEIIKEIKTNAEIEVASGDLNIDVDTVKATIPGGIYSTGTGPAAVLVPTPVTISGSVDGKKVSGKIQKGSIK